MLPNIQTTLPSLPQYFFVMLLACQLSFYRLYYFLSLIDRNIYNFNSSRRLRWRWNEGKKNIRENIVIRYIANYVANYRLFAFLPISPSSTYFLLFMVMGEHTCINLTDITYGEWMLKEMEGGRKKKEKKFSPTAVKSYVPKME